MNILVINSGSSSIKFSIFDARGNDDPEALLDGELSGIGGEAKLESGESKSNVDAKTPADAMHAVFDALAKPGTPAFAAIGYRVVHPGPKLDRHQRITDEVLKDLEDAAAFAPLHDPDAVKLIREAMQRFPALPHFACFDTIFHQTMPEVATTYPIPLNVREHGVRRYGFHGLSCESIVHQLRDEVPQRMIIAHLGGGCSVTALRHGRSIDTSMGLTPTGGVVMGTRPGDLDPGLVFYLLRQSGASIDSVEQMLNHDAGLKALAGVNDMRKLRADPNAATAIAIFIASLRKTIGGYAAMYGLDMLVFTGGIGEHDAATRTEVLDDLFLPPHSVKTLPAQEDLMIAMHVARLSEQK